GPGNVPPVASEAKVAMGIHTNEVSVRAAIDTAGRCEVGTGVDIGPSLAADSRAVDFVGTGASEADIRPFVHGCDVHVACRQVAGDLNVAEEGGAQLSLVGPGETVVSGVADEEGTSSNIEVVP